MTGQRHVTSRLCVFAGDVVFPISSSFPNFKYLWLDFFPLVRKVIDQEIFAEAVGLRCGWHNRALSDTVPSKKDGAGQSALHGGR